LRNSLGSLFTYSLIYSLYARHVAEYQNKIDFGLNRM